MTIIIIPKTTRWTLEVIISENKEKSKMKKNLKIDYSELNPAIELDAAESYVQHRINLGKPLTQRAFNQAMNKALCAHEVGMTPTELIDWTMDKGWQGINIAYTKNALAQEIKALTNVNINTTRGRSLSQQLTDKSWAN